MSLNRRSLKTIKPLHVQSDNEKTSGEGIFDKEDNSLCNSKKKVSGEINDKSNRSHNNPRKRLRTRARMEEKAGKTPVNNLPPSEHDIAEPEDTMKSITEMQIDESAEEESHRKRGRPDRPANMLEPWSETEHSPALSVDGTKETGDALSDTTDAPPTSGMKNSENPCRSDVERPLDHVHTDGAASDSLNQDCKPVESSPVVQKRKVGRPRKSLNAISGVAAASTKPPPLISDVRDGGAGGPVRRLLRNRGGSHSPTEGEAPSGTSRKFESPSSNNITSKALARLRSTLKVDEMPGSSVSCDEGTEMTVPRKGKQIEQDYAVNADLQPLEDFKHRGERSLKKTYSRHSISATRGLRSNVEAVTPEDVPSECLKTSSQGQNTTLEPETEESLELNASSTIMPASSVSSLQAVAPPVAIDLPSRSVEIPFHVKREEMEIALGDHNSVSETNGFMPLQWTDDMESPSTKDTEFQFVRPLKIDKRKGNFKILKDEQEPRIAENMKQKRTKTFGGRRRKRKKSWWDDRGSLQSLISDPEANREEPSAQEDDSNESGTSGTKESSLEINSEANVEPDDPEDAPLLEERQPVDRDHRRSRSPKEFECEFCNRRYKYKSLYIIHRRTHTGERPYQCVDCGKGFSQLSNFKTHMKKHQECEQRLQCTYCKLKVSSTTELHAHVKTQHWMKDEDIEIALNREQPQNDASKPSVSAKDKVTCQFCGKVFRFTSALRIHLRVHTGEKPYSCQVCGKSYSQGHVLRNHEVTHWSVKPYSCNGCGKTFLQRKIAERHVCKSLKPLSLSYTCHVCKQRFSKYNHYTAHLQTHKGAELFCCSLCDQLFGDESEFNAHCTWCSPPKAIVNGKPISDGQQISYSLPPRPRFSKAQSVTHQQIIFSPPRSILKAVTSSASPLKSSEPSQPRKPKGHKASRNRSRKADATTSVLPFQTSVISSSQLSHFVSKLNKLDRRSDPRKYLCPRCGRLFRHMGRLRAHMLTHARDQTFTCGRCGKTLGNWRKLWQHQSVHRQRTGRFTCPQCDRRFRFVGSYMRHMKEHPQYQWIQQRPNRAVSSIGRQSTVLLLPYQCEECDASFNALDLLFSHQLGHLPPQGPDIGPPQYPSSKDPHHASSVITVTLSPHMNSFVTDSVPEPPRPTCYYPSTSVQSHPSHMPCHLSAPAGPPRSPPPHQSVSSPHQSPSVKQALEPCEAAQKPTSSPSCSQAEMIPGRNMGLSGKTVRTYERKTMKVNRDRGSSLIGTGEVETAGVAAIKCADCGVSYSAMSDLYDHYLQHARGEL